MVDPTDSGPLDPTEPPWTAPWTEWREFIDRARVAAEHRGLLDGADELYGRPPGGLFEERQRQLRRAEHAHRSRAEAAGERFTLAEIGERDGWTCRLCGEPVPRPEQVTNPRSRWMRPVLDHVVPLAPRFGGTHVRGNVRLAHARCNELRGPRWGRPPLEDGHPEYRRIAAGVRRWWRRRAGPQSLANIERKRRFDGPARGRYKRPAEERQP
jgi:hypothetical protein